MQTKHLYEKVKKFRDGKSLRELPLWAAGPSRMTHAPRHSSSVLQTAGGKRQTEKSSPQKTQSCIEKGTADHQVSAYIWPVHWSGNSIFCCYLNKFVSALDTCDLPRGHVCWAKLSLAEVSVARAFS